MALYALTDDDLRPILRERVAAAGGQRAFARRYGINHAFISRVLAGKQPIGRSLAHILGYAIQTRHYYALKEHGGKD